MAFSCVAMDAAESTNMANQMLHQPLMLRNTRIAFIAMEKIAFSETTSRMRPATWNTDGSIVMLDGLNGKEKARLQIDGAIEASPAVYNDMMVIGTTEKNKNNIYGIRIQ